MGHLDAGGSLHPETASHPVDGTGARRDDVASAQLTLDAALAAGVRPQLQGHNWGAERNRRDLDAHARRIWGDADVGVQSSGAEPDGTIATPGTTTCRGLLTPRDVEKVLRLGRTMTYELLRSGEIPSLRIGRVIRVSPTALDQWIAERSGGVRPGERRSRSRD